MILVVDPGAESTNIGDKVISQAVQTQFINRLRAVGQDVETIALHTEPDYNATRRLRQANEVVVCGTNLLSSHMRFKSPWPWSASSVALCAGKMTVFGAGWWQYQQSGVDVPTARWFRRLAGSKSWALRDVYSAEKIAGAGVWARHVSCPTLWGVTHQSLPSRQGSVVATLTDFNQDRVADRRLISLLYDEFDSVRFWPQGPGDASYMRDMNIPTSDILEATLAAFDEEVSSSGAKYVGLRLHAGIRAIQHGTPALILGIDNRSREIARSVDLQVTSRYNLQGILALLDGSTRQLSMPSDEIRAWLAEWDVVVDCV